MPFTLTSIRGPRLGFDGPLQKAATLVGEEVDLGDHHLDILALLLEQRAPALQPHQEGLELLLLVARNVVKLEQLADLREGKTETLAAERELETGAIAVAENPGRTGPRGTEKTLVLVEPYGAGGYSK